MAMINLLRAAGLGVLASVMAACASLPSTPLQPPTSAPGTSFRDCPDCPELVAIPGGSFMMGSSPNGRRLTLDSPAHPVTVPPFALMKYPVTRSEYSAFVDETGFVPGNETRSEFNFRDAGIPQTDNDPVVYVGWNDAQAFAHWLSRKTGHAYRLPSEAEYEYAARAGTTTVYWWGDEVGIGHANCVGCGGPLARRTTSPVSSFPANPFGLYDMLGNVFEWVEDCLHSEDGAPVDGSARTSPACNYRITRGGSWGNRPGDVRSASRTSLDPTHRNYYTGFRLARGE